VGDDNQGILLAVDLLDSAWQKAENPLDMMIGDLSTTCENACTTGLLQAVDVRCISGGCMQPKN